MITLLLLAWVTLVVLAACDGGAPAATDNPTPTAEAQDVTPDPSAEPLVPNDFPTSVRPPTLDPASIPTLEVPDPGGARPGGVGTLVAEGTVDPERATQFSRVILVRTGGPTDEAGQTLDETIIIDSNGTVTRNGATGQLDLRSISALNDVLNSVNLFAVQANFLGPIINEGPVPYTYQLMVDYNGVELLLNAQDGYMPREIQAIMAAVLQEGFKVPRP
ncbi:MAG: hypothetical protein IPM16_02470 [Chloroflexi bacterium]|nr:hypothetical protein [Chloroflexota bacterium]